MSFPRSIVPAALASAGAVALGAVAAGAAAPPAPAGPSAPTSRPAAVTPATRPTVASAAPRLPAPATRPTTPASAAPAPAIRPSGQPAAQAATRPAAVPTSAAAAAPAGWYPAARLRLEAMRVAADEMPLDGGVKARLLERLRRAQTDLDAAHAAANSGVAGGAAPGAARGGPAAAARGGEAVMAQLDRDVAALLRDAAPALTARAAQIADDVRDFERPYRSNLRTMIEVLVQPTVEQRPKIDSVLGGATRQLDDVNTAPRDPLDVAALEAIELRRQQVGFATRAAFRAVLTPQQLKDWDEVAAAAAARATGNRGTASPGSPASRPSAQAAAQAAQATQAAEIEAAYSTRLEAMRLAAEEGPYPVDQKAKLLARIGKLKADIAAVAATPIVPPNPLDLSSAKTVEPTVRKVDALRRQFDREVLDVLGGTGSKDFDDRVTRINSQVLTLANPDLTLDHLWLSVAVTDLQLTPEQQAKINQTLADRLPKLKQALQPATPDENPVMARQRRDQVALAARAAIRQVLNKQQLKAWDEPWALK